METLSQEEIDFLNQLSELELSRLMAEYAPLERQFYLEQLHGSKLRAVTTRDSETQRQREKRSLSAEIVIPECKNPPRREACLADPERFLRTYMPKKFRQPFGRVHTRMIEQINDRALLGGKKAIAAPRSRGKSTIVKGMNIFLVAAELVRFIVPICATTKLGGRIYRDFQKELGHNELLFADFPEICAPIRALEGAPQRASRQHIRGHLTNIYWSTTDYLRLARVPGDANEYLRSLGKEWSPYGGVKMTYCGLDAALRGLNIDDDRPDYIIIDDPETRESAKSLLQIEDRIEIIEKDIEGLEGQEKPIAITMITTLQNRYCLSAQYTDRDKKSAWDGERYGWIEKWPKNMDLWEEYITRRGAAQRKGDRHGMDAVQFYLDNRELMDSGAEMLADNYKPITLKDGREAVHSALQEAFNKIADTSMDAFKTEYQNDPPAEEEIETLGLTAARVQSRITKYPQYECASTTEARTLGIDLGNRNSHWADLAWEGNAIGSVVDYGIIETHITADSDGRAIELAVLASLEVFADDVVAKKKPLLVLIDSGDGHHRNAVYEFCRRRGAPFFPSKGWDSGRFRLPMRSDTKIPFLEAYASYQPEELVWLYNINTEYWKKWLQQRFMTATFDEGGHRLDGSLALFDPLHDKKRHLSYSHHITAEEERLVPVAGRELKREWYVKNRNNHWLDATALACAAAGCLGVRLVEEKKAVVAPARKVEPAPAFVNPYGQPFLVTQR